MQVPIIIYRDSIIGIQTTVNSNHTKIIIIGHSKQKQSVFFSFFDIHWNVLSIKQNIQIYTNSFLLKWVYDKKIEVKFTV